MKTFPLDLLQKNKKEFIELISAYYPLDFSLLEKYEKVWDWKAIANNRKIHWPSEKALEFIDKLFSMKKGDVPQCMNVEWSPKLINELIKRRKIDWDTLMWQEGITNNPECLSLCLPQWSKGRRGLMHPQFGEEDTDDIRNYRYIEFNSWGDDAQSWAEEIIENCPNLHWDLFSGVRGFPWSMEFIEKYQDKWDWRHLSHNHGIHWTEEYLEKYQHKLDWRRLSYNPNLPWSREFLKKFEGKIDFFCLCYILLESEPMDDSGINIRDVIEAVPHKVLWAEPSVDHGFWEGTLRSGSIINSPEIFWTLDVYEKLRPSLDAFFDRMAEEPYHDWSNKPWYVIFEGYWTIYCNTSNWSPEFFYYLLEKSKKEGIETIDWENISSDARHLWSDAFINEFEGNLNPNLYYLTQNIHFPWDHFFEAWVEALGAQFDKYHFSYLSGNPQLSISIERLERYQDKWNWGGYGGLSSRNDLTEEIILHFKEKWDWLALATNKGISPEILMRFPDKISASKLSRRKDLDLDKMDFDLDWDWMQVFQNNVIPLEKYLQESLLIHFLDIV